MNPKRFRETVKGWDDSKLLLRSLVDRTIEHRCDACHHKLGVGFLAPCSVLEIKCPKCGSMMTFAVQNE